ncbi:MAG: SRPBCC family protein [Anaerolineales bacterium]|jgi:hypothetical protein|nr:SRPBCC family protein [Anaerolineales bacterium]
MPVYNLEFQTQIKVRPQTAYDHLRDPHNLVGLQPLLIQVDNVRHVGQGVSYETVEAFRWMNMILYRNRIRVQAAFTDPPHQMKMVVHSFPKITLNVEYTFTPQSDSVLVKETMQIHTYAWLAKFVTSEATKAQTALFENLKNRLEGLSAKLTENPVS